MLNAEGLFGGGRGSILRLLRQDRLFPVRLGHRAACDYLRCAAMPQSLPRRLLPKARQAATAACAGGDAAAPGWSTVSAVLGDRRLSIFTHLDLAQYFTGNTLIVAIRRPARSTLDHCNGRHDPLLRLAHIIAGPLIHQARQHSSKRIAGFCFAAISNQLRCRRRAVPIHSLADSGS